MLDFYPSLLNKNVSSKREAFLNKNQHVISIAAVLPKEPHREEFRKGIELALQKINSTINMPFSVFVEYYEEKRNTAQKIVRNLNHTAILGYSDLKLAPNAGMIFTENNLLFFHFCTNYDMQNSNLKRCFSVVPSDKIITRAVVEKLEEKNLSKPYVIVSRAMDYNDLQSTLYPNQRKTSIDVVSRFTFFESEFNFDEMINKFDKDSFDSIIFVGRPKHCIEFIDQFRNLGFTEPVLIPEKFGSDVFNNIHAMNVEGEVIIFRGFITNDFSANNQTFLKEYMKTFKNEIPGLWAAYAYESLLVLCDAARKINSKNPLELSNYLYFYEQYDGLVDSLTFNKNGVLDGKTIYSLDITDSKLSISKKYIIE